MVCRQCDQSFCRSKSPYPPSLVDINGDSRWFSRDTNTVPEYGSAGIHQLACGAVWRHQEKHFGFYEMKIPKVGRLTSQKAKSEKQHPDIKKNEVLCLKFSKDYEMRQILY